MGDIRNNRKLKADATRKKIYESADKLFSQNDYKQVSVDSIVKMAGVSKGSFYVHFSSKDALIALIISNHVAKADTNYKAFLDAFPEETPADLILLALIDKITDVLIDEIGYSRMKEVYKAQLTKDINTDVVMGYNREIYQMFNKLIDKGMNRGEFNPNLSSEVLARHLMQAIRGITYEWCIRYPDFDLKTQAAQHFELLLYGSASSASTISSRTLIKS